MKLLKKLAKTVFGKKGSSQGTPFFVPETGEEVIYAPELSKKYGKVTEQKVDETMATIIPHSYSLQDRRTNLLTFTRETFSASLEQKVFPAIDLLRSAVAIRLLKHQPILESISCATLVNVEGLKHELQETILLRMNASKLLSSHRTEERYYDLLALTLLELSLFQKINELENGPDLQS